MRPCRYGPALPFFNVASEPLCWVRHRIWRRDCVFETVEVFFVKSEVPRTPRSAWKLRDVANGTLVTSWTHAAIKSWKRLTLISRADAPPRPPASRKSQPGDKRDQPSAPAARPAAPRSQLRQRYCGFLTRLCNDPLGPAASSPCRMLALRACLRLLQDFLDKFAAPQDAFVRSKTLGLS